MRHSQLRYAQMLGAQDKNAALVSLRPLDVYIDMEKRIERGCDTVLVPEYWLRSYHRSQGLGD